MGDKKTTGGPACANEKDSKQTKQGSDLDVNAEIEIVKMDSADDTAYSFQKLVQFKLDICTRETPGCRSYVESVSVMSSYTTR